MQWLLTSHVRWHHKRHGGSGHLWQGRFKAFAVQDDANLHAVLRYVERNPLRAGLVTRSEEWPWSSLTKWNLPHKPTFLCESPLARVEPWVDYVNLPQTNEELELLRASVERGIPFGEREWVRQTAARLGLAYAI
jgi:putative transposase